MSDIIMCNIKLGQNEMELILSSRQALSTKYSHNNFRNVNYQLTQLQTALKEDYLESAIVYVDDSSSLQPFGLRPVNPENPHEIKKLIDDIQNIIVADGKTLDFVLIIGGDDIIPFHRIPNPVYSPDGDPDTEIFTDNPYASSDEEYLVPERALGRIPDSASKNIYFLLNQIKNAIDSHRQTKSYKGHFGYSAEVWNKASKDVYQAMGQNQRITYSPPTVAETLQISLLNNKKLLYFNLHGSDETAAWYGQGGLGGYLTTAFTASQLNTIKVEQAVVFCEACYGAHIFKKEPEVSLPLMFLNQRADCFVGSTMIAYGSLVPPISAADILAKYFFQYVQEGLPYGVALLNAKNDYTKKMIRLGLFHVDEVDAKTLLEFVLYGDPSLTWEPAENTKQISQVKSSRVKKTERI